MAADPYADRAPAVRGPAVSPGVRVALRASWAVLSLLMIVGSGVAWATSALHRQRAARRPGPGADGGEKDTDGNDQNILLIGNDSRAGATRPSCTRCTPATTRQHVNTDTMMVLHVPADGRGRRSSPSPATRG